MTNPEITIGTRVRSFDFPDDRQLTGERACYVEGEVTGFAEMDGCMRYVIRVERDVFGGEPRGRVGLSVYPPVNGTPTHRGVTDFVEKI